MLTVATVCAGWQAGDWMDAYLGSNQVIMITRLSQYSYQVVSIAPNGFWYSTLRRDAKLWIEEGINGVAA